MVSLSRLSRSASTLPARGARAPFCLGGTRWIASCLGWTNRTNHAALRAAAAWRKIWGHRSPVDEQVVHLREVQDSPQSRLGATGEEGAGRREVSVANLSFCGGGRKERWWSIDAIFPCRDG